MAYIELFEQLSAALEGVGPDEILTFQAYDDGYTVILKDYRKFTQVRPIQPEAIDIAEIYPPKLPADLRPVYDNPKKYKLKELSKLAEFLNIHDAPTLRKAQLIADILAWKDTTYIPYEEKK